MIIYVFNNEFIENMTISTRLSGMYSVSFNDIVFGNVFPEDNKWFIKYSDNFISNLSCEEIITYKIYVLRDRNTSEIYYLVALPKYNVNSKRFFINGSFSLGNTDDCDIYYPVGTGRKDVLKAIPIENGRWMFEVTPRTLVYVGNKLVNSDVYAYNGDSIFFYGLRVILLGKMLIVNNFSNALRMKTAVFKECSKENDYVPKKNNDEFNDSPLFEPKDYFFKAPRFNFSIEEKEIKVEAPPNEINDSDIPTVLAIGPQITMVFASCFSMINVIMNYASGQGELSQFIISVGTMGVMVIGAITWPIVTRIFNKKRTIKLENKRVKQYTKYLERKKVEIQNEKNSERTILEYNNVEVTKCVEIINQRSIELWQRNIDHTDFLDVRVGIGDDNTKIKISESEDSFSIDGTDKLFTEMKKVINFSKINNNVPITYNFTDSNITAIIGEQNLTDIFLDCVFLQLMTFHSYVDLKIITYTKNVDRWDFLKNAPHSWNNNKTKRYFATTIDELIYITSDLEKEFDARVNDDEAEKEEDDGDIESSNYTTYKDFKPYYLFFIDDISSVRNISLLKKILKYKRNMGFSILTTSSSTTNLPSETTSFLFINEKESAIISSKHNNIQKIFKADFNNNLVDLNLCMQKLANIPIVVEKDKYELPQSLSFLEMYNVGRVEQLNCLSRWEDNNPILSLSVPIGVDQNGELFKMDIHEKAFGPHGLVAGTTGSGKSEWIITYILSLAVNFSPDEVQFVLIDYKGGGLAKSFENSELNIKLPHLAGTITNLDKSEIFRSVAAIESELKKRQEIFNQAREKLKEGSMDIYKYQECYRKGLVNEPMSHLLIISDEFAELKQQQPEFMEQLISTSRIGRSLGIHLILATQKPSGVVNEQIWSNSKFKVCLKVQDKSDSNEVLKKPDAAYLKQVGAFYLQVGNDDYYNLGQSAWAGAKYYPSDSVKKKIDDSIQYINNLGQVKNELKEDNENEKKESHGEQLLNIVSYICKISSQMNFKKHKLWLPNIPDKIYLNEIIKKYSRVSKGRYNYDVAIGEYDEPRKQEQGLLTIDLAEGNVAIMGQNGSGIDNLISTIIFSAITEHTPSDLNFYIIDFGAETMKKFSKFPHVGEVVFQDDIDKVVAVLDLVISEIDRRKELLSDYNGSFEYYNRTQKDKLPLIVMTINEFDIFNETLPKLSEIMNNLFRDSPQYGVIFIVSVSTSNGLRTRQLQFFNHVIVTHFNDDTQYRTITNCRRGLIPRKTLGRGICKTNSADADSYCEFQTAFITSEDQEFEYIKKYADVCCKSYKTRAKQLAKIPDDVKSDDLVQYVSDISSVPIGVDFYEKTPSKYDFSKYKIHLFSSRNLKKNINSIYGITALLSKVPSVKVRIVDFSGLFKKIVLDTKLFNDNLNVVFGALEHDVLTRKDTQDWAINIVIGIGSYKKKLSKGGILIFENIFKNLNNSKKVIFIFVDDYDKLRLLKLEDWYSQVDDSHGVWFGSDVSSQSLINVEEINHDGDNLDFDGMAYQVDEGKSKLIKTILEGED